MPSNKELRDSLLRYEGIFTEWNKYRKLWTKLETLELAVKAGQVSITAAAPELWAWKKELRRIERDFKPVT